MVSAIRPALDRVAGCIGDLSSWMRSQRLQLNAAQNRSALARFSSSAASLANAGRSVSATLSWQRSTFASGGHTSTVTSRCKLDLSRAVSTVGLFHQFCARYTPLDENHGQKLQKSSQTFSLQIAKFAANSQYRFTGTLCLKKHRIDKRFPLRKHG